MSSMWERVTRLLGAGQTPRVTDSQGSPLPPPQMEALAQAESRLMKAQAQVASAEAEIHTLTDQLQQMHQSGYQNFRQFGEALLDAQARLKVSRERLIQHQETFQQMINAVHADRSLVGKQIEREGASAFPLGLEAAARMAEYHRLPWWKHVRRRNTEAP